MPRLALAALLLLTLPASVEAQTEADRLEALYWARQEAALGEFGTADIEFMTGMIGHHAQALVMTALAEPNGAGPEVRTLAARIANAQRDEIRTMQRWLRDRGQPVPTYAIDGTLLTIGM